MSKRILLSIILVLIIIGVIAINIPNKIESNKLQANEVVSMKFFVSKERENSYHSVPKHIENENINKIIEGLNNASVKADSIDEEADNSTRRLYMFLDNKDVVVINGNDLNKDEYIVKFQNKSIFKNNSKYDYVLIKSDQLKEVFQNFEIIFNSPENPKTKISI